MNGIFEKHRHDLERICRRCGVETLEIFGSAARDDFNEANSDIDFLVRFGGSREAGYADRYFDLAEGLENVFGRPVDLLTDRSIRNHLFEAAIARDRTTIYAS